MPATLLVAPGEEPVALAELKAQLRLESSAEDALLMRLITAARAHVEMLTRRVLITQTWRIYTDSWPRYHARSGASSRRLDLPVTPIKRVLSLTHYDSEGNASLVDPTLYRLDASRAPPALIVQPHLRSPGRADNGIEIDVEAGYGGPSDVPAPLREAILRLAALWFEHRTEDDIANLAPTPPLVDALITPYRVLR